MTKRTKLSIPVVVGVIAITFIGGVTSGMVITKTSIEPCEGVVQSFLEMEDILLRQAEVTNVVLEAMDYSLDNEMHMASVRLGVGERKQLNINEDYDNLDYREIIENCTYISN